MAGRRVVHFFHTSCRWRGACYSIVCTVAAIFIWQFAVPAHAQTQKPAGPLHIEKIRGDLYMLSGVSGEGDVGVEVTSEGVILGDDMFDRNHDDLLAQVKSVSDKPVKYVFNTHYHDDHSGGDAKMLPIAAIIVPENLRANLAAHKLPYYEDTPGTPIGLPQVTFTDQTSVHLGGKEVRAYYFGRGHTNGDAIIYYPDEKTIQTGDLFLARTGAALSKLFIFLDYAHGASLVEWTRTLDRALALDFDRVIPGHGPVSTRADVVKFKSELEAMRTRLTGLIQQGTSKADIAKVMESDYGWKVTGCPPSPPMPGCLSYQQLDGLITELKQ